MGLIVETFLMKASPFPWNTGLTYVCTLLLCIISSCPTDEQLDPLRCSAVVTGEEQICDIELDKRTIIIPRPPGQQTMNFKALWALAADSGVSSEKQEAASKGTDPLSYGMFVVPHFISC